MRAAFFCLGALLLSVGVRADDEKTPEKKDAPVLPKGVERLAESARKSVVVITFTGRDGKRQGLGTGFIVAADGLIATNMHVLGEARPIQVQLADGTRHDVTIVHASDRSLDLALVRIDAKGLTPLPLGDSEKLIQGQAVVALGNPHGLTHSVVSGVVSGKRDVEGRPMIQLAMPIEPGNSGGPLIDLDGKVHGIITMKSLVTNNLGFAMPVNALKKLMARPNPIPMARWLTIGTLDPEEWTTLSTSRWRQRAGKIMVEGMAAGIGGRAQCLSRRPVPDLPYEVAVSVHLGKEAGAAGLVFQADGKDKHYGFYPSNGQLRLTRFDGPDVFSWKVLHQEPSEHYKAGDWNRLKVRVEKDRILCFVNGKKVHEEQATDLSGGQVGLAKFRDTQAEFKSFQLAKQLPSREVPAAVVRKVTKSIEGLAPKDHPGSALIDSLAPDAPASMTVLRERAKHLEQQAAQLRQLAGAVHQKQVLTELSRVLQGNDEQIDLMHAALLIARLDNDELDIEPYRKDLDRMAREIRASLPKNTDEPARLEAMNKYLFAEHGFHGSRTDYYNKSNSYLNEVLDDREGLPITLSLLYLELGRRLDLKIVGVPLPGHFIVRFAPIKGEGKLIDVFEGGKTMSRDEADRRVRAITGSPLNDTHLEPAKKRAIIVRMFFNLLGIARDERDLPGTLRYLDGIITVEPENGEARWMRAVGRFNLGDRAGVKDDTAWLLDHPPEGVNLERVRELRRLVEGMDK